MGYEELKQCSNCGLQSCSGCAAAARLSADPDPNSDPDYPPPYEPGPDESYDPDGGGRKGDDPSMPGYDPYNT